MAAHLTSDDDQELVVWRRFNAAWEERVRAAVDDELVEEHRHAPRGPHSDRLTRVLRFLRSRPIPGKLIVVEEEPWRSYRIGVLSGVPGEPASILDERYPTYDDCLHAIFLRRLDDLAAGSDAAR
jgi:hypothetical protein